MRYRKKPVIIEAHRWFTNGDHPEDECNSGRGLRRWRQCVICETHHDQTSRAGEWVDEP